jgi:dTMP kinase
VVPDRVFVLDLEPESALGRQERPDRIGGQGVDFQEKVRDAYRDLAQAEPARVILLDASLPVEELVDEIMERVS